MTAERREELTRELLMKIATSHIDDPGESDLDNEQPVTVHLTLKEVRRARMLLGELYYQRKIAEPQVKVKSETGTWTVTTFPERHPQLRSPSEAQGESR